MESKGKNIVLHVIKFSLSLSLYSGTSDLVAMDSCTAEFVMEQRVQDVEEHFRRSLLSLQQQKQQQQVTQSAPTTGSLPLATSSVTSNGVLPLRSIRKTQEDHEPHQILITENSSTSSSPTSLTMHPVGGVGVGGASQTVLTSQNNVQFIVTSTPSNNVMTTAPLATNGPTLISALPGGTAFNQPIFLNIPSTTNNDKSEGEEGGKGDIHVEKIEIKSFNYLFLSYRCSCTSNNISWYSSKDRPY